MHQVRDLDAGGTHIYLAFEYRRVNCPLCGTVKRETLSWLANSARFTQRFEDRIGLLCREMSVKRVAELNDLSWDQVCRLEKSYMRRLMEQNPPSEDLRVIGIDEISIQRGHTDAIVVSDLDQRRPIWLGGQGGTEQDMNLFYEMIGEKRCQSIQLAVMDMWRPFRKSTQHHAPNVRIVFDKFHIIKHLSAALDEVRRSEYKRASEKDKRFIKGQRYTLLSHKSNLDIKGQAALGMLLKANERLNKAYLLKESFGQLWDYSNPRKFFDHWKSQLRWQRLPSF